MSPYRCFDNNVRVFYEEYRHPRRNCIGEVRNYGNKLFLFYFQNKFNCQSEQDNLLHTRKNSEVKFSLDDYGLAL